MEEKGESREDSCDTIAIIRARGNSGFSPVSRRGEKG